VNYEGPDDFLARHGRFLEPLTPEPKSNGRAHAAAPTGIDIPLPEFDERNPPPLREDGTVEKFPRPVSPVSLKGLPPERPWIIRDWIPCEVVTGLYGDGGLGKSLLAQLLQTAANFGSAWLGLPVEKVPSLGVYCEDSHDELWRRQADINVEYGVDYDALGEVHWLPRLGEDNLLMTFSSRGVGELTRFHAHVLEMALDLNARQVIVDTAADTFGGDELKRNQVRQFVQIALGSIAQRVNGSVLLCAHPSQSGITTGEGTSGSTGWSNAFRSRLYLRAPAVESGEKPDPNARILQRRKANYAARNDELRLRWRRGVIGLEEPDAPGVTPFGNLDAKDVFLELLDQFEQQNRPTSDNSRAGNFAPRLFGHLPREQRHDFREADFRAAMEKLFASSRIQNLPYGRKGDERQKLGLKQS
jgi:RecA-family ATPase